MELVDIAGDALIKTNPELEKRIGVPIKDFKVAMRPGGRQDTLAPGADISMECQFYINYSEKPRTVRGPHIDRPSELFAALLYFRQPEDDSIGSDLEICKAEKSLYSNKTTVSVTDLPAEIDPALVTTINSAPYKANTLVLFLNSPESIHAVSPRTPTLLTRRHINFCCDVPHDLFQIKLPLKLKLKRKISDLPFGWRLAKYIN
ncbi:2OG-Fe(II) oxygenase [Neptunomonas japonica]|uniref:2OG-Fe(II) oxygenase n=1 Tax=Neptunomonas japonica TaxID=417574 RepID=UPI001915D53E|nr:2OG-Fe(II) oxygenase [Neptunomonas japonica]